MDGGNFVSLKGYITDTQIKVVGENNNSMFKGKFNVPGNRGNQIVKVAAWGIVAEELSELTKGTYIIAHGHIEESSYKANCRFCKAQETKYWTEVIIDNFMLLDQGEGDYEE